MILTTMVREFFQVDAFTDRPFAGNPAAVFVMDRPADAAWMQLVAAEMNLAETAFVEPRADGTGYGLRWFTPAVEVDLCGHATLAAAHVLWETRVVDSSQPVTFHTRSGPLGATRDDSEWIELDFPSTPPFATDEDFDRVLGIRCARSLRTKFDAFVELESATALRALRPDFAAIRSIDARGLIVTATSDSPEFDFISRFFAPQSGVDEDPVTGSAYCALGPYWAAKLGKNDLCAFQASKRGGVVRVRVRGDRVLLGGQAVTVFRGALRD